MKKILLFLMIAGLFVSCYDDYRLDYEHSTVAFSAADGGSNEIGVLYRTVVKGEGLKLDVGIYLAGILENTKTRWADFEIDESLLDGTAYQLMPDDYYTLSNNSRFNIPSGELVGRITITLDSARFVDDTSCVNPFYAIPFRLTETSEDSILSSQSTKIVVIKYINHYEGYYDQTGTYTTKDGSEAVLDNGEIDNVILAATVMLDTIVTNGMGNLIGADYRMKLHINNDNSLYMIYVPNPDVITVPYNINQEASALSTSYISSWEDLDAINDGYEPADSADKGPGAYGNWPNDSIWNWVQYDFAAPFSINASGVYWWGDGGGITIPYASYVEYLPMDAANDTAFVEVPNPVGTGVEFNQYAMITFDPVLTTKVRLNFVGRLSVGILEWKVWGIPYVAEAIGGVTPNGENSFNPSTHTFTLNYTINYAFGGNTTDVSSTMTWRNRIRDGVNEWRR
jgi:hypothetical protein